jgi:hypothetical protein
VKSAFRIGIATALVSCGVLWAQSGTVNTLSVNPRQNQEMTNSTGTESGQPTNDVPGSQNEPNGLIPVTSDMSGYGSNGNMSQSTDGNNPARTSNANKSPAYSGESRKGGNTNSSGQK